MNYIIHTPSAVRLKEEIFERVSKKTDTNGKGIVNWHIAETDAGEKVLVYANGQWAERGCVAIRQISGRNELQVQYIYWESCENRVNGDDKIILGRFTEFLLVHFSYFIDKVIID